MKKFLSRGLFFLLSCFFLFFTLLSSKYTKYTKAQTTPVAQKWICLSYCTEIEGHNKCQEPDLSKVKNTNFGEANNHHRLLLKGENLPTNVWIYLVACVNTGQNIKCTTGNQSFDEELSIAKDPNHTFLVATEEGVGAFKKQLSTSRLEVVAMSYTPQGTDHRFFAVIPNPEELVEGQGSTVQYGTFEGSQEIEKCAAVHWDPYGRIFDSLSLEPIANVSIALVDPSTKTLSLNTYSSNPQTTSVSGEFNFFVKTGYYILAPTPPSTHLFLKNPNLHPNYSKAYFDIYTYEDLNDPQAKFYEKEGEAKHLDIPLQPKTPSDKRISPLVPLTYGVISQGNKTEYSGKVSHPLTLVKLIGEKSQKLISKTNADKFGFWKITVLNDNLPQDEGVIIEYEKVDLTATNSSFKKPSLFEKIFGWIIKTTKAQILKEASKIDSKNLPKENLIAQKVSSSVIDPIFPYLEGYAYDEKGNVIPNALVMVKLKMSNKVYYQTKADEKGFFQISKEYLPIFEYYLEFQPQNKTTTIRQSTAEFAKKNQDYLSKNKINLMTATKNNQPIIVTPSSKKSSSVSPTTNLFPQIKEETSTKKITPLPSSSQSSSINWVLLGIVILLILVTIVIFLVFFLRQKI